MIDARNTLTRGIRQYKLLDAAGQTDIHIMDTCYNELAIAHGIGRKSPFKQALNWKITQLREGGFITKWIADDAVAELHQEAREDIPFALESFQGAFTILGLCLFMSTLIFLFRFTFHKVTY